MIIFVENFTDFCRNDGEIPEVGVFRRNMKTSLIRYLANWVENVAHIGTEKTTYRYSGIRNTGTPVRTIPVDPTAKVRRALR